MCGVRGPIGIAHAVGIAMVCGHQTGITIFQGSFDHFTGTLIYSFTCFDRCLPNPGMAHHIGIGKVQADKIDVTFFQLGDDLVPDLKGAHFRLQVVSGNFRRRAEDA